MISSPPSALQIADGVDLAGKTCVITGASAGLGRKSARALAATKAHVVLTGRNAAALADTDAWVHEHVRGARTSTVALDLTSLASVQAAAATISEIVPAVHILMNNAGVMFTPFGRTSDGFEMHFGTNHLGHFELTRLLIPQLVSADGARIVNLSSDGHRIGDVDLDDPNWLRRDYDKFVAYGASKTANVLHAVELDRRLRDHGVRAFAVHPGVVATSLARHMTRSDFDQLPSIPLAHGKREELLAVDVRRDVSRPEHGAATQVWAAVTDELADSPAVYLADCAVRDDAAPYAVDPARALALWNLSEDLCA